MFAIIKAYLAKRKIKKFVADYYKWNPHSKSLVDLLYLLLISYKASINYVASGLCGTCATLFDDEKITRSEYEFLVSYLTLNRPTKEFNAEYFCDNSAYWWPVFSKHNTRSVLRTLGYARRIQFVRHLIWQQNEVYTRSPLVLLKMLRQTLETDYVSSICGGVTSLSLNSIINPQEYDILSCIIEDYHFFAAAKCGALLENNEISTSHHWWPPNEIEPRIEFVTHLIKLHEKTAADYVRDIY